MSDVKSESGTVSQILDIAQNGTEEELEAKWLELTDDPPLDSDFYLQFIKLMRRGHALDHAHSLLLLAFEALAEREEWDALYKAVKTAVGFWPDSPEIRKIASRALKALHGSLPNFTQMIGQCKGAALPDALSKFESLLLMLPGNAYTHPYWGEGVVKSVDFGSGQVTLEFPSEERAIQLDFLRKHLTHLAPDSFLARRRLDAASLRKLAEADPAAAVRLALQGRGGTIQQGELKTLITGGVIPEERWNSWWTKARHELHIDPMIDFDIKGGARAELKLRDKPKTIEEEAEELFLAEDSSLADRVEAVQMLLGAQKAGRTSSETVSHLLTHINTDFRVKTAMPLLDRIQLVFMRDDLLQLAPDTASAAADVPPTQAVVTEVDKYDLLRGIRNDEHAVRALKMLAERDGERFFEQAAELLPKASSKVAQSIWKQLEDEEHVQLRVQALRRLFDEPLENPDTYAWATRNIAEQKWPEMFDHIPLSGLIPELVDNVSDWNHLLERNTGNRDMLAAAKQLVAKTRALLQTRNFAPLCDAAEDMSADGVQSLRKAISVSGAFNEAFKNAADHQLLLTRRDLKEAADAKSAEGAPPSESDLHYCTSLAREQKLKELNELNTVRIPHNSREIERARSEGDLKENAGYIYAKEQQKLLMQASLQLTQALQSARIFNRDKVNSETVGFGVFFDAENIKTGQSEHYTVLGRFETDPDKHIISYSAPFMQPFAGKRVGDEVKVKHPGGGETVYRITKIGNALESGEWEATGEMQ